MGVTQLMRQRGSASTIRAVLVLFTSALLGSGIAPCVASEAPVHQGELQDPAPFPVPRILEPNVAFWTRVFSEYSRYQSVIHSASQPMRVYEILDFRDQASLLSGTRARAKQVRAEREAIKRIAGLLRRVDRKKDRPALLDAQERRVFDMFAGDDNPARFRRAAADLRVQRGVREKMSQALRVSGKYLPSMETVFQRAGLPISLTRLPLVESSFDEKAYSKAGAAGVWQFMPASARIYMRLDEVVDERVDPWVSTEAAARHLKDDYALLQDWPLAITAYNHGRYGIARGLKTVNGSSLADLVERYRGKRFGFASRNYYAEFLAAVSVERDHAKHFGELRREDPLAFEEVRTGDHYLSYETLVRASGVDEATFRRFNPAFRSNIVKGRLRVPPRQTLRLPPSHAAEFSATLASVDSSELHDRQARVAKRVKKGKSRHSKAVKVGRKPSGHRTHRVRAGQTLSGIALRYGISLRTLCKVNGLGRKSVIRPGQRLRIPRA
jgi:membrane-bound lytic murein transglycosylase D